MTQNKTIDFVDNLDDDKDGIVFSVNDKWLMKLVEEHGKYKIKFNTQDATLSPKDISLKIIECLYNDCLLDDFISEKARRNQVSDGYL